MPNLILHGLLYEIFTRISSSIMFYVLQLCDVCSIEINIMCNLIIIMNYDNICEKPTWRKCGMIIIRPNLLSKLYCDHTYHVEKVLRWWLRIIETVFVMSELVVCEMAYCMSSNESLIAQLVETIKFPTINEVFVNLCWLIERICILKQTSASWWTCKDE